MNRACCHRPTSGQDLSFQIAHNASPDTAATTEWRIAMRLFWGLAILYLDI